ncbi:MAG: S9 family peptidase [Gemmatimonadetes bacterium]|nr:S9 family peptidase [Gemmatimonadota bacterium]
MSLGSAGCAQDAAEAPAELRSVEPPVATVVPEQLEIHGHTRIDNYYWLNQREDPDVIAYLTAENDYTNAMMGHTTDLQDELFEEIKGRIKQTDLSIPVKRGSYFYYTRTEDGQDYPIHARKRESLDADEEVILDVNELAEGHDYYNAFPSVSSGEDLMAFAEDTRGRRIYDIQIKNLETGELYPERIEGTSGNLAWAEDNQTLFYTKRDPQTLRSFQVYRHTVGTDPGEDVLVFEETDEEFSSFVWKTKSKAYVMISSSQTTMDEHRYIDASAPKGDFTVFVPRERGHEHGVDHFGDHFYMRTNLDGAENFQLMRTPVSATGTENWEPVIPHRDDVFLEGYDLFEGHLVVEERERGLVKLRIRPWSGGEEHYIEFDDPAYLAYTTQNPELATSTLRFGYTSLAAPRAVYDYDMNTRERALLKQDEVLGGYDASQYVVERLYAPARDGQVEIPVSLVYRDGFEKNGESPLLLYAYGSYGASMDPTFSSTRLSLLDRGFAYAIAHIRGGQELGRQWYEDGKMFNKKNTFTDYVDVADFLIAEGYTSPDVLFARGGSAGGLLMGAVVNMRPELFRGVVAHVPFVDVVTTMLDESIPLTTFEWDEWGNPTDLESYQYMLSYSPYDQVEAKDYPNMLVTTGLHDSQVQYWEPAKWVAKLRALKTDDNRLLLKTHMDAGHGGGSGRDRRYEELAFEFAFMLDLLGDDPAADMTSDQ